jgi:hypothetical protein
MENLRQTIIIEEIMTTLSNKDKEKLLQFCSDKFGMGNYSQYKQIITQLLDMNIITLASDSAFDRDYYKLTSLGRDVINIGGWEKYLEQEKITEKENVQDKQKENEKLTYDLRLAKWQVKTFWPLFIIALIGGICGIISLILQII